MNILHSHISHFARKQGKTYWDKIYRTKLYINITDYFDSIDLVMEPFAQLRKFEIAQHLQNWRLLILL